MRCEKYPVLRNAIHPFRRIGVRWYLSRQTRDEEEAAEGTEGSRCRGGVDVVFKFVTLFPYEFFTTREIMRNAVRGYVSTISANANVRQNVMTMSAFSLRVSILVIFSNLAG